ncbi:MAG: WYL domain-containing protein [Candidatus Nanopelagicaceae bacterium]|nr:WYL domain-containing protein [Candidatus Nanopelagicaceae bacterium]
MSETAAERALRLLDLVPFILENQGISIHRLASEFDVSKEEILKDLNLLFVCGLPGYTPLELIDISFEDEEVYLRDPQNLSQPRNLTISETIVTRIALSSLHDLISDKDKRAEISALQDKLSEIFNSVLPENALHVEIDKELRIQKVIESAIQSLHNLRIEYLNLTKDEVSSREVSPLALLNTDHGTTLHAFCHKVGAVRSFKLAQIISAIETDNPSVAFTVSSEVTDGAEVTLRDNGDDPSLISSISGDFERAGDNIYVIKIFQDRWLLRTVFSIRGLEILGPEKVRNSLREEAELSLERYRELSI